MSTAKTTLLPALEALKEMAAGDRTNNSIGAALLQRPGKDTVCSTPIDERNAITEPCFNEKFAEYASRRHIAFSRDDTYALVSLVSAGLGIGFAPEWTLDLPNRGLELKKVSGIDFRIGLGLPGTERTGRWPRRHR